MRKVLLGALVGFALGVGGTSIYLNMEHDQRSRAWETAMQQLTDRAQTEFRSKGCMEPSLQTEMERYSVMSDHGLWCKVLVSDASAFDAALKSIPACHSGRSAGP
jgi:hypothetical protein